MESLEYIQGQNNGLIIGLTMGLDAGVNIVKNPYDDALLIAPLDGTLYNRKQNGKTINVNPSSTAPPSYEEGINGLCFKAKNGCMLSTNVKNEMRDIFTVAFWFKIESNGVSPYNMYRRFAWYALNGYYVALPEVAYNGQTSLNTVALGYSNAYQQGTKRYDDEQWHLMITSKYKTNLVSYIDNTYSEIIVINHSVLSNQNVTMPLTIHSNIYILNGNMYNICFWERTLSSIEMDYIWNNGKGRFQ